MNKKRILAICGSTRKASSNLNLIHAAMELSAGVFEWHIFDGIDRLPHFNPDLLTAVPGAVTAFYEQLQRADGVLICSPEYAIGVPGSLKNAIDWTVSAMSFSGKPVALVTASTSGAVAHRSLLGTLLIIESRITADTALLVPAVKTKVSTDNHITDSDLQHQVVHLLRSLSDMIDEVPGLVYLPRPDLI